jgi:ABC-type dipeptide/oligopeptide/nickel transport system permease subunit
LAELSSRAAYSSGQRLRDALLYFPLVLGVLILLGVFVVVLFGPYLAPYNPYVVDRVVVPHYDFETEEYIRVPVTPREEYPLGSDEKGMDILSLLLYGARNTMIAGVLVAAARVGLGLSIGLLAGWNEGKFFDRFVMGAIGLLSSLPILISGMILIFALGIQKGILTFFVALTLVGWTEVAQYIRSEVLVLRTMPFMEGARVVGMRDGQILVRQIIPNILPQLAIITFLEIGAVLMLLGELALLGVFIGGAGNVDLSELMGPQNIIAIPTQPEWGAMIASGFRWFRSYPHVVVMPAAAIFLSVLGFNLTGEGLRAMFERRGLKTGALLSRRMLLVAAILLGAMVWVFNSTQPSRWFGELASAYRAENVAADTRALATLSGIEATDYVAEGFREMGIKGGVRWSELYYRRSAEVYDLDGEARFELITGSGRQRFSYGDEYVFVAGASAGSGSLQAPLMGLYLNEVTHREVLMALREIDVQGRVVMLGESNAPASLAADLAAHGAAGILWVADPDQVLEASRLRVVDEDIAAVEPRLIPTLRISAESAQSILAAADFANPQIFAQAEDVLSRKDPPLQAWPLAAEAAIDLQLQQVGTVDLTSLIAYHPGTDADLGDEIVLLVAPCDDWWQSGDGLQAYADRSFGGCAAPDLLELARIWETASMDSRRPVLFVAWGGGEFGDFEFSEWLTDEDSFDYLSAPGMRLAPEPAIVIQLLSDQGAAGLLHYGSASDAEVLELLQQGAQREGLILAEDGEALAFELVSSSHWAPYAMVVELGASDLNLGILQKQGQALTFALVRMVRESILNTD